MAEDDGVGFGEASAHWPQASLRGAGVVNPSQYYAVDFQADAFGKLLAKLGTVDVAVNGRHGAQVAEVVEHRVLAEVTGMDDQVGRAEQIEARLRQNTGCACRRTLGSASAPRQMGVGDQRQPQRIASRSASERPRA